MPDSDDDPEIVVGEDANGAVVELDASQWSHDALAEALRRHLEPAGRPVSVWVDRPDRERDDASADAGVVPTTEQRLAQRLDALGLHAERDVWRMERDLPLGQTTDVETRAFLPGDDDAAWLAVNNRAFRGHREQGGWTPAMLAERMAEPWFDPEGFLIHEIDGAPAAFCWTKVHGDETPPVGEVYVVAVDPDFTGRGLGRALTLAGYQHLAAAGITRAMLYVDADNVPATTLYRDIGLRVTAVRRLFTD